MTEEEVIIYVTKVSQSYRMTISAPKTQTFQIDVTRNLIRHITEEGRKMTRKYRESCYK